MLICHYQNVSSGRGGPLAGRRREKPALIDLSCDSLSFRTRSGLWASGRLRLLLDVRSPMHPQPAPASRRGGESPGGFWRKPGCCLRGCSPGSPPPPSSALWLKSSCPPAWGMEMLSVTLTVHLRVLGTLQSPIGDLGSESNSTSFRLCVGQVLKSPQTSVFSWVKWGEGWHLQ